MGDPRVGTTLLGKLRVNRVVGAGGMGVVYEVEHLVTGHRRALKVLHADKSDDPKAVARLMREASIAGRVQSPRLVDTYDVGTLEDGSPYLLMELLEGRSLADRLDVEERLSPAEAVRITGEIAEGLMAAHAAGVLHRDLTPKNIFLVRDGDVERVRIVDFGLSRMLRGKTDRFGHLTATGAFVGTPYYVSPEQACGDPLDARSDQYALAVMLYECLAGRRPFGGSSLLEVLGNIASGEHTPLVEVRPEVGVSISRAITRALSRRPEDRFVDVMAFASALSFEHGVTAPVDLRGYAETAPMVASAPKPVATPTRRGAAPSSATRPRSRSSDARPVEPRPRWGRIAAMIAIAGVSALVITFGATAAVLHLRRAPPSASRPDTLDIDDGQVIEHLRRLRQQRDYRTCADLGLTGPRTIPILEVAFECAEQGLLPHEAQAVCAALQRLDPDHASAIRCRRLIRRHSRRINGGPR